MFPKRDGWDVWGNEVAPDVDFNKCESCRHIKTSSCDWCENFEAYEYNGVTLNGEVVKN
jgi:hypothetical protein